MLRRSVVALCKTPESNAGEPFKNWPWPKKLPFKKQWFTPLSRRLSIADETRTYFVVGDFLIVGVLTFTAYRVYTLNRTGAYQTHLCHLTENPPAIIANDYDFKTPSNNRTVSRAQLDQYREDVVGAKAARVPVEAVIFKY